MVLWNGFLFMKRLSSLTLNTSPHADASIANNFPYIENKHFHVWGTIMNTLWYSRSVHECLRHSKPFPTCRHIFMHLQQDEQFILMPQYCRYNYWKKWKTLWHKEKLLVLSNFSFCYDVSKSRLLQTRQKESVAGKRLTKTLSLLHTCCMWERGVGKAHHEVTLNIWSNFCWV